MGRRTAQGALRHTHTIGANEWRARDEEKSCLRIESCAQCTFHNEWQHDVNFHCMATTETVVEHSVFCWWWSCHDWVARSLARSSPPFPAMSDFSINNTIQSLSTHTHWLYTLIIIRLLIAVVVQLSKLRLWVSFGFSSSRTEHEALYYYPPHFSIAFFIERQKLHGTESVHTSVSFCSSAIRSNWMLFTICTHTYFLWNGISCAYRKISRFYENVNILMSLFHLLLFLVFISLFIGTYDRPSEQADEWVNERANSIELESAWGTMFDVKFLANVLQAWQRRWRPLQFIRKQVSAWMVGQTNGRAACALLRIV